MKKTLIAFCSILVLALSGCATYSSTGSTYGGGTTRVEYGTVTNMVYLKANSTSPISLGTVLGGAAGGLVGHQLGGGTGKTIFTIAGAVAGAVAGDSVQRSIEKDRIEITVRLDSGADLMVNQVAEQQELRVGDRVRVVDNKLYRN
jgi:Outer membrane lipoprotein